MLGQFGIILGHFRFILGHFGLILGHFGIIWSMLGYFGIILGPAVGPSRQLLAYHGLLGVIWARLRLFLKSIWAKGSNFGVHFGGIFMVIFESLSIQVAGRSWVPVSTNFGTTVRYLLVVFLG